MKELSNTKAELKKIVTYKKACMFLYDNDGNGEMEGCFKLRAIESSLCD